MRIPRVQFRLALLLATIAVVGLGLAVLRQPHELRISIILNLTIAGLLAATVLARLGRTPGTRAWWFGFSLFGWTHLLLIGSEWREQLPTTILIDQFAHWYTVYYAPYPTPMGRGPWYTNAIHEANNRFYADATKILQVYVTLALAGMGATLTRALAHGGWGETPVTWSRRRPG